MTIWDVLGAVRRLWLLAVYLLVLVVVAVWWVGGRPGVYEAQVDVRLYLPASSASPNALQGTTASLIATTGLLEREVSGVVSGPGTATSVTLSGRGLTSGTSITLPDSGGQWGHDFRDPVLDVQSVGRTEQEARLLLDRRVEELRRTLDAMQAEAGIEATKRIQTTLSPDVPIVNYRGGSRTRAMAALLVLGVAGLLTVVSLLDRWILRRGARARSRDADDGPVLVPHVARPLVASAGGVGRGRTVVPGVLEVDP